MPTTSEEERVLAKIAKEAHFALRIMLGDPATDLTLADARKLVESNAVSLRGWDFPYVGPRETYNAGDYVSCVTDWERHVELWRMYRSSQFVYLANFWDVSFDLQQRLRAEVERSIILASSAEKATTAGAVSFIGLIYSITEMYVFAERLALARSSSTDVTMKLRLHNVERWVLASGDPRIAWHDFHQCRVPTIDATKIIAAATLIENAAAAAIPAIQEVFQAFNWNDAADHMIAQWQDRLLSGRFGY